MTADATGTDTTGTALVPSGIEPQLAVLVRRHRAANTLGMQLINLLGGRADALIDRLPKGVRDRLEDATGSALEGALKAAQASRGVVPDQRGWFNTALTTAMGAAGGAGGLPTAMAELPVTVTVLLRAIQGVAAEHGFDPADPEIQKACLSVFASAGPLARDEGVDMGFLSARMTLSGATVNGIIARVAPRLAAVLGQKLAAQAVPLLGAAAGAATNYAFTSYYQEMAHVAFGLRRIAKDSGTPYPAVVGAFDDALKKIG